MRMRALAVVLIAAFAMAVRANPGGPPSVLVNPGFEQAAADGTPVGWSVATGLDPHRYGDGDDLHGFDEVRPVCAVGGFRSERCLGFPGEGTWRCPVFGHSHADGGEIDGKTLGKAAASQTVELPAGRYRFGARLRTADGALYAGAFALGVNLGPSAPYAHDGSTGIRWTSTNLAMRRDQLRSPTQRGEWARYRTEPFTVGQAGPVTVWIRFQYANENQMDTRWQADDAAIEPVTDEASGAASAAAAATAVGDPSAPAPPAVRQRAACGIDDDAWLVDPGASEPVDVARVRPFRRARRIPAGTAAAWEIPFPHDAGQRWLLVAHTGPARIVAGGTTHDSPAAGRRPTAREWRLRSGPGPVAVRIEAPGPEPVDVHQIEVGSLPRTVIRALRVNADAVGTAWTVGTWDAGSGEFEGGSVPTSGEVNVVGAAPTGPVEIEFEHRPRPGRRYVLLHGFLAGRGSVDLDGDGIAEWIMETKGHEITDLDVTDRLPAGTSRVVIDADGGHDFAALVETAPGADDPGSYQLALVGDDLAERMTRVADNTWFWLRELHYEPTGFVDASVPRGRWYGQYWPIDIAFALREWVFWGHQAESERIARLTSEIGWHGHSSNRSGGYDNNGGCILASSMVETARRSGWDPALTDAVWDRVKSHAGEVVAAAAAAPHGLARGTNWENAGNRDHGPCYALNTTLGCAASLDAAAMLADRRGEPVLAHAWGEAADRLRNAALEHLVLAEDHRCPSGFVLPSGTWAYGLRVDDGSIEDQPLAGYFWASTADADVFGITSPRARAPGIFDVYGRTLDPAVALERAAPPNGRTVSGYAVSYDGAGSMLRTAILCDRIDMLEDLLRALARSTDTVHDRGAQHAELSRWAYGGPRTTEDTNLVNAAEYLYAMRMLLGIDDLLADGAQLSIAPRVPWTWRGARANDWPVRRRAGNGDEAWTRLTFALDRDESTARVRVSTADPTPGVRVRLGPFPVDTATVSATVEGIPVETRVERSGDAAWAWLTMDTGPDPVVAEATADR